jgi:hypothetical protein
MAIELKLSECLLVKGRSPLLSAWRVQDFSRVLTLKDKRLGEVKIWRPHRRPCT